MKIQEATYKALNSLIGKSFDCNARADNFAYNIDYVRYPNIGNIYHHSFAHIFPGLADQISDLMIQLNARPVREALNKYDAQYLNLKELFEDNDSMAEEYRQAIKHVVDVADYNGDYEVRIFMENFLLNFLPYIKQSDIWKDCAAKYQDRETDFDIHFEELTTFIPVSKK